MSYYMGDYYRGDPGFWSTLGGIAKSAVGFIPGIGPSLSAGLTGITSRMSSKAAAGAAAIVPKGFYSGATRAVSTMKGAVLKHPVLTGAGAAGIIGAAGVGVGRLSAGKHLFGGGGRRRKRMRVTNPKALRRALRRAYGFERVAMKTIKLLHPRKHARFGGFKKARKRSA
jgi:hypothetical protein